jgi:sulfite reductase (NADPH) flavoprotein alpha-component
VSSSRRQWLARWHRRIALALLPVYAIILVTGIVLAFRPLRPAHVVPRVDVRRVMAAVRANPDVAKSPVLVISDDRSAIGYVKAPRAPLAFVNMATGAPTASRASGPDFFDRVEQVHKNLWGPLGFLVTVGTLGLFALVIFGPFIAGWNGRVRASIAWHSRAGWLLWPLLALLPASLVLMKIHPPVITHREEKGLTPLEALQVAAPRMDLSAMREVGSMPGGAAMLLLERPDGGTDRWVVRDGQVAPIFPKVATFGEAMHTGEWLGGRGAWINIAAALGLLLMLSTGVASWWKRRRAPGAPPPQATASKGRV